MKINKFIKYIWQLIISTSNATPGVPWLSHCPYLWIFLKGEWNFEIVKANQLISIDFASQIWDIYIVIVSFFDKLLTLILILKLPCSNFIVHNSSLPPPSLDTGFKFDCTFETFIGRPRLMFIKLRPVARELYTGKPYWTENFSGFAYYILVYWAWFIPLHINNFKLVKSIL